MGRRIRVRAIRKEEPDTYLYVLALIALARQLQEEEQRAGEVKAGQSPVGESEEVSRG
jgi:hypothetical protein